MELINKANWVAEDISSKMLKALAAVRRTSTTPVGDANVRREEVTCDEHSSDLGDASGCFYLQERLGACRDVGAGPACSKETGQAPIFLVTSRTQISTLRGPVADVPA